VGLSSNKIQSFDRISLEMGDNVPKHCTDRNTASLWLEEGHVVVCRALVNSHSGRGITIVRPGEPLPEVPLYVQYKKKRHEYRVHVFRGQVIDFTQKKKVRDFNGERNNLVRNLANGWIFAREGVTLSDGVADLAIRATATLSLDFGAADIIWNEHEQKAYVLEVNTAPGLEGTTLVKYAHAIKRWYDELGN
jgi:hypothetical protein